MLLILVFQIVLCSISATGFTIHQENNACSSLKYYPVKAFSSHCYVNPNVLASTPEMIKLNGYKYGTYKVVSEDGYTSLIFRVLPHDGGRNRQPVILEHGVQVNSAVWTWMGNRSLAFVLTDAGYDVWLMNQRDSGYTTHNKYKTSDYKFWANSLDDVATKGVPAMLNTVATATNKSGSIIYIGHSRGSTLAFMYASENPKEAQKFLRGVVALSPIAYLNPNLVVRVLCNLAPIIGKVLELLRISVINYPVGLTIGFYQTLCTNLPYFCKLILLLTSGSVNQFQPNDLLAFFSIFPISLSVMETLQYAQIYRSGKFQKYNYGKKQNLLKYQQQEPPLYNLGNFKLPIYMYYGKRDILIKEKSVKRIFKELGSTEKRYSSAPVGINKKKLQFGHNDFIWSKDIQELFYKDLLRTLSKLKPKSSLE
ncbi:gastric triacylglycerol lipase-like [Zophobas morio]|uniref:gastric triacylglycerol lipase-like n=1 Tax=Zophobas morio TaxID=2755281 RepID=UPI0030828460